MGNNLAHIVDPGELDRTVTVQQQQRTQTGTGEVQYTWGTFKLCKAKVEDLQAQSGEEYRDHKLTEERVRYFTIRYAAGLNTTMRLLYEGQPYDIRNMAELGRKRFMKLEAVLQK